LDDAMGADLCMISATEVEEPSHRILLGRQRPMTTIPKIFFIFLYN